MHLLILDIAYAPICSCVLFCIKKETVVLHRILATHRCHFGYQFSTPPHYSLEYKNVKKIKEKIQTVYSHVWITLAQTTQSSLISKCKLLESRHLSHVNIAIIFY